MVFAKPDRETLNGSHELFDGNGTLAVDGKVSTAATSLLRKVSIQHEAYIVWSTQERRPTRQGPALGRQLAENGLTIR